MTARERAAIQDALGPVPDDQLLRAVRDGRGRTFQRLEFLGDSVLDLLLAVHAAVTPGCPGRADGPHPGDPFHLATDHRLAAAARSAGLGGWLEWEASDERLADLVETCTAVAWRSGGWAAAVRLTDAVVHPVGSAVLAVLAGAAAGPAVAADEERRLGAALLELAAAAEAYAALPTGDAGALSQHRAQLHRADRVAAFAARTRLVDPAGDKGTVSDRVERWLARRCLADGADPALAAARDVLTG